MAKTSDYFTDTSIEYELLMQEAIRGVVRDVLAEVADNGIPGNHHFYIAFMTHEKGVRIPAYLKEKYPEDMTIVLQNKYWGLVVTEDHFDIELTFGGKAEKLSIPFAAVIGFVDPEVQFALNFQSATEIAKAKDGGKTADDTGTDDDDVTSIPPAGPRLATATAPPKDATEEAPAEDTATDDDEPDEAPDADDDDNGDGDGGDNVVTLDTFRRKK